MAKYQFKCSDPACDYVAEIESPITEPVPRGPLFCLLCAITGIGKVSYMKRVWNPAAVIFHGGGWASKS